MDRVDVGTGYRQALQTAVEAGTLLRDELHRPGGPRGSGGHAPVDGEAEALIRARLEQRFPDRGIRGEELPDRDRPSREAGRPVWDSTRMGWVCVALQNAFHQLLHAGSLEAGVVDTVARGGDADTNAAIAGALLGAVHGRESVPWQWRDRVPSGRPIEGLPGVRRPRPRPFWPVDALLLAERLLALGVRAEG
jgi:hypothetical protein